jgi:septum formation protein
MPENQLILASSSPFRKELLARLHLPFETISPDIDESRQGEESAQDYVSRLAREKAWEIAKSHADAIVIGSDQCAYLNGQILGKPGSHENALRQLQAARGNEVIFYTGLCVMQQSSDFAEVDCIEYRVGFRGLSDAQIEHYLQVEQPYNCAGSFKSEGYGISLFSYMSGDDPTSIIGLPLIRLIAMLEAVGVEVV